MQEGYHGGGRVKRMTKREIDEMIKNMKKSEIVRQKSKEYHRKEELDAEDILKKLGKDD